MRLNVPTLFPPHAPPSVLGRWIDSSARRGRPGRCAGPLDGQVDAGAQRRTRQGHVLLRLPAAARSGTRIVRRKQPGPARPEAPQIRNLMSSLYSNPFLQAFCSRRVWRWAGTRARQKKKKDRFVSARPSNHGHQSRDTHTYHRKKNYWVGCAHAAFWLVPQVPFWCTTNEILPVCGSLRVV